LRITVDFWDWNK